MISLILICTRRFRSVSRASLCMIPYLPQQTAASVKGVPNNSFDLFELLIFNCKTCLLSQVSINKDTIAFAVIKRIFLHHGSYSSERTRSKTFHGKPIVGIMSLIPLTMFGSHDLSYHFTTS